MLACAGFALLAACGHAAPVTTKAACTPTVYPLAGTYRAMKLHPNQAGLLLDGGGTDVDAAWRWAHDRLVGKASTVGGNVVVLRADLDNAYDPWIVEVAKFASARTIAIPPCASRPAIDALAKYVDAADLVFFAGGDQTHYVVWKNSALIRAVQRAYARGAIVGGTSAGLAVQGEYVYDSAAADKLLADGTVKTPDAVRDPLEPAISFTTGFLRWPTLDNTITDTHFARRDRFGRLTAFMARLLYQRTDRRATIRGLGVDERSALVVNERGVATLMMQPARGGYATRGAYVVHGALPTRLARGKPLDYTVHVAHLSADGQSYDLLHDRGTAQSYSVTIDGASDPFYNRSPYAATDGSPK